MGPAVFLSSINNGFAPQATWNRIYRASRRRDSILQTGERQVSSTTCGLTGKTSKQGLSNVQTSFSVGGEVLQNPRGHLEQKMLQILSTGRYRRGLPASATHLWDVPSVTAVRTQRAEKVRGERSSQVWLGSTLKTKKALSSFPFLNSCRAGHDIWPKAAASRKQISTSKAWKDWHVCKTWQKHRKEENRKSWITPERFRGCQSPSRWDIASTTGTGRMPFPGDFKTRKSACKLDTSFWKKEVHITKKCCFCSKPMMLSAEGS